MSDKKTQLANKTNNPDWLIRGILGKLGEIFDKLTGRNWQPSSNLATSELTEKLIFLLDSDIKDLGVKGKFVPHYISLKIQWDKFTADSDTGMNKLKTELLAAAVDHINDFHLHTFAPLKVVIKTDYFVEGVLLNTSYENLDEEKGINLTLSGLEKPLQSPAEIGQSNLEKIVQARWNIDNVEKTKSLKFSADKRLSVGRSSQNDFQIEDPSVSKVHASLFINQENLLTLADTGSTNGTFINDQRIHYGQSFTIKPEDNVKFGSIEVNFEPTENTSVQTIDKANEVQSFTIDEFEFRNSKTDLNKTFNQDAPIKKIETPDH